MKFIVGSKNPVKITALRELASEFLCLHGAEIEGLEVPSSVTEQPMSLYDTYVGALSRASNAAGG